MLRQTITTVLFACSLVSGHMAGAQRTDEKVTAPRTAPPITIPAAEPQVTDVDVAEVQSVRPIAVTLSEHPQDLLTLMHRYGIERPSDGYGIGTEEDPNVQYKRARPFPEIEVTGVFPPWINHNAGLTLVESTRLHWPWPSPVPGLPESKRQKLWRWEVPKPLQRHWWSEARGHGADRHWALCLYDNHVSRKSPETADPQLFYFDTLTGLRWQTTIPVRAALMDIAALSNIYGGDAGNAKVQLGITPDGSRVLAFVSRPDKKTSLLCVFDGSGRLLRTLRFPGYTAVGGMMYLANPDQLERSPSGRTFLLSLEAGGGNVSDVACLLDAEGTLITRFASEEGKAIQVTVLSDKYALARSDRPKGKSWEYVYQLP